MFRTLHNCNHIAQMDIAAGSIALGSVVFIVEKAGAIFPVTDLAHFIERPSRRIISAYGCIKCRAIGICHNGDIVGGFVAPFELDAVYTSIEQIL